MHQAFAEAACLPLATITAYEAFFDRLAFGRNGGNRGESLLIIGGAGGVGADHVINHRRPLRPQVEALDLAFGEGWQRCPGSRHRNPTGSKAGRFPVFDPDEEWLVAPADHSGDAGRLKCRLFG